MKNQDLEAFLVRHEGNSRCNGFELNVRGRKRPIKTPTGTSARAEIDRHSAGNVLAISTVLDPVVPLPDGAKRTVNGTCFADAESAIEYAQRMGEALPHHVPKLTRSEWRKRTFERGKSWKVLSYAHRDADPLF